MKPDQLLLKLKETSSPKTCMTLDAIFKVCVDQERREVLDFSVATIARLGFGRGVPKAQSLRNRTGESYRALLRSFEDKHRNHQQKIEKGANDWIDEIQNPRLRLLVRMQASELAAAADKVRNLAPPGTRIDVRDHLNDSFASCTTLTSLERRALEYLVSQDFLTKWSFSISEYGEIVDGSGAIVLKAGTVDAVTKALTHL